MIELIILLIAEAYRLLNYNFQPLTAITEALDGAGKIYELKSFSDAKNSDHNREVRQAADHVYGLLVDLSSLFARRQRIAFSKAQQAAVVSTNHNMWSDYVARRLPLTINAQKLHALFRPVGISGRVFHDADESVSPSVAASTTPSTMALTRLRKSLEPPNGLYQDEEDRLFGPATDEYLDESVEDRYFPSLAQPSPVGDLQSSPKALVVTEEDQGRDLEDEEGILAEELFSKQEQPPMPNDTFTYESGANMLESFNYAVSSHGGSYLSASQTGSLFGSERSSSPLPNPRMRRSSFPGVVPHEGLVRENHKTEDDLEMSFSSKLAIQSEG